jgi:hypothetical protein
MLNSQTEVFSFYVQDIINECRNVKEKLNKLYSQNIKYFLRIKYSPEESKLIFETKIKELFLDIEETLDFVASLSTILNTRKFVVTGVNNDQVIMKDWQYLPETYCEYINKIIRKLKRYYKYIGVFYDNNGCINESLIIKINKKTYTYSDINNLFGLSVNYLFDIAPLVYYDKFRDTLYGKPSEYEG